MRGKLTELLRLADLRDEEITIYLALLKARQSSAAELIVSTGIRTMTVYRTLKRLKERNLIGEVSMNRKQSVYVPLSLQALVQSVAKKERRLRKLELSLRNLDRFLPFLSLEDEEYSDKEPLEVREGIDAFREEYLRMPDVCRKELLVMGSMYDYWRTAHMTYDSAEERGFIRRRLDRGIGCRLANVYTLAAEEFRRHDSKEKRITKLAEDTPIKRNYLAMSEHHVAHFSCDPENPRVIVIREPELVDLYRKQFETMWMKGV